VPVAVASLHPRRRLPLAQHLGIQRLARGDQRAQPRERAQLRAARDHAVLGRSHAQDLDPLALEQLEALLGIEAPIVQERAGPAQPGRDERVARGLRPAARRRAPHELARPRVEPVLGLHALARQVALGVQHALGLARRPAGEGDQARVIEGQLGRGSPIGLVEPLVGNGEHGAVDPGGRQHVEVALVGDDRARVRELDAQPQVAGAQLLVAGKDDRPHPEAGDHRVDPFGAVAHERQHDVTAAHAAGRERAGQARAAVGDLAEADAAPLPVARDCNERLGAARSRVDDIAGEVHGAVRPCRPAR
jgi:hypothetical protein